MSSYNEIDGTPSTANYHLLTKVLRNRWGFQGFTISDLRSIGRLREHGVAASDYEAAVKAVNAGLENETTTQKQTEKKQSKKKKNKKKSKKSKKKKKKQLKL